MAHPTPTHNIVIDITAGSSGANDDVGALNSRIIDTPRRLINPRTRLLWIWICVELVFTVCQIVASVVVLSLCSSKHDDEISRGPEFIWVAVYASGCVATFPLLYCRYYRNHNNNNPLSLRLERLVEKFKIGVCYFFFIWFAVGIIVWIDGGLSSAHEDPSLHRLFLVFLASMYIRFAFGVIEDVAATQIQCASATPELINSLPTYNFKVNNKIGQGGVIAAGTQRERIISAEDAVCCICLAKYENKDKLRELLPCSHLFHNDCVDKWLKMKALCPLCKSKVGEINVTAETVDACQPTTSRFENGFTSATS